MAHQYRFDVRCAALLTAGLALLASPLACQSDEQDGDGATTEVDALGAGNGAAGTAGMASGSGSPPASAVTTPPPANERPAAQNLAPAAPASTPSTEATPAAGGAAAETALTFEACTYSEGNYGRNCDSLYVSMKQVSPPRCVQLTFDNCGEYGRRGLAVDVPMPWRLDSGTVGSDLEQCELGVYYTNSSVALRASGSATWNETTRLPSELVLDVTLETSTSTGTVNSVDVTTTTPLTVSVCDG